MRASFNLIQRLSLIAVIAIMISCTPQAGGSKSGQKDLTSGNVSTDSSESELVVAGSTGRPSRPIIGVATAEDKSALVSFNRPEVIGGAPITSYTVTANPGGRFAKGESSPIAVTGLSNGTTYTFTVKATNDFGTSIASRKSNEIIPKAIVAKSVPQVSLTNTPVSTEKVVTPQGNSLPSNSTSTVVTNISSSHSLAGAPIIGTATARSGAVSVTFSAPISNGGATITEYIVTSNPEGKTASAAQSPIVVTGLSNGTVYTFSVKAKNSVGTGPASSSSNSVVPIGLPSAPLMGTVTGGDARASVYFSGPRLNGGSPISSYVVTSNPGNVSATGTTSPLTVTGLTNGTAYTFSVRAINVVGSSVDSTTSMRVTPMRVPDAPIMGTATAGNTHVTVSFTAPAVNGGSPITSYTLKSSSGRTVIGTTSPITMTNLLNETAYTFTIKATSAAGVSDSSGVSNSVIPKRKLAFAKPAAGNRLTIFEIPLISSDGEAFSISSDEISLSGSVSGCTKSIVGSGTVRPIFKVTGCTGVGPLTASFMACTGGSKRCAASAGSTTDIMITNSEVEFSDAEIFSDTTLKYTGAGGVEIGYEIYMPKDWQTMSGLPLYIHIHGGGWGAGVASEEAALAKAIAKKGFIVLNINYTLSDGTKPYTKGPDDILELVKQATSANVLKTFHVDPLKVSIGGGSAGGHLALYQATRIDNPFTFNCVLSFAGPTNLNSAALQATHITTNNILNSVWGSNPPSAVSPALNVNNFKGRKLFLLHNIYDSLVPVEQAFELSRNMRSDKSNVEIIENYWTNPNPYWSDPVNSLPTQAVHVLDSSAYPAAATFLSSRCGGYASATARETLNGWPVSNAIDNDPATSYSSPMGDESNSTGHFIAYWFGHQTKSVSHLKMTARVHNNVVLAFPPAYEVYLTNAANTAWELKGTYTAQPGTNGSVILSFGSTTTAGVMIVPKKLGKDDYNNYYLQMAELLLY